MLTEGFYWDHDDKTRAFSERFFKRTGHMPSMIHAGTYSATISYLKAVKAAGTKDAEAVARKLKELPVDDAFAQGKVLANGRMVHDMYLFEVKKPSEFQEAVGLLQGARGRSRRQGVLFCQGQRLPADEVTRSVIPGRCEASNPELRDSWSGPSDRPGKKYKRLLAP